MNSNKVFEMPCLVGKSYVHRLNNAVATLEWDMLARSAGLLQRIYTYGQAVTGTCCSWQRSQAGAWKQNPRLRNALGGVLLSRRCVIGGSLADDNNGNKVFYNNCCIS